MFISDFPLYLVLLVYFIFNSVCVWVCTRLRVHPHVHMYACMWECTCECRCLWRPGNSMDPLKLESELVVSPLMWLLRTELESYGRWVETLTTCPLFLWIGQKGEDIQKGWSSMARALRFPNNCPASCSPTFDERCDKRQTFLIWTIERLGMWEMLAYSAKLLLNRVSLLKHD